MTRPPPPRAFSIAFAQAGAAPPGSRTTLWPRPDELMTGLTTHGVPMASTASRNSASLPANRYGDVRRPSSSAARRRMPSRSIVSRTARAVGMTR